MAGNEERKAYRNIVKEMIMNKRSKRYLSAKKFERKWNAYMDWIYGKRFSKGHIQYAGFRMSESSVNEYLGLIGNVLDIPKQVSKLPYKKIFRCKNRKFKV